MNNYNQFYKLQNQIKHYEWGSIEAIPRMLGLENSDKSPWAELWMGTHPGAPSAVDYNGNIIGLPDLISKEPEYFLGERTAKIFGELPFLFKLLAAGKPLSIQAHPNQIQAKEGFERENNNGLSIGDSKRNYKDPNHKPEIICALTPFTMMCGFRKPSEIYKSLEALKAVPVLQEIISPLAEPLSPGSESLEDFFYILFNLPITHRKIISDFFLNESYLTFSVENPIPQKECELIRLFCGLYPQDAAVLSPLYLNVLTLMPGEAVFVKAGIMHSYISGFGIELMANSDNVLRGGLTPKNVDKDELFRILDFNPVIPQIHYGPELTSGSSVSFRYPAYCDEFSLSVINGTGEKILFKEEGPAICIVTDGALTISGSESSPKITLKKGESVFIPAGASLDFTGAFTAYCATNTCNSV